MAAMDHSAILEAAIADPKNTTIDLPPADVNARLHDKYTTDKPVHLTREKLWDMEIRKAKNPALYLGPLLQEGSLRVFPSTRHGQYEDFVRVAKHRPWKDPNSFHTVIEQVRLDHEKQKATFIGVKEYTTPDGEKIVTEDVQPLFHVLHGVEGEEDKPLNTWLITHLTEQKDEDLERFFLKLGQDPYLRGFVEVYIRDVLNVDLKRKE